MLFYKYPVQICSRQDVPGKHNIPVRVLVSGEEYLDTLKRLCQDGYLSIEQLISVPEDVTGFPETRTGSLPADPAPFNHSTKIAILRVRRKQIV